MDLYKIEFISCIFDNFTGFNISYNNFVGLTKNSPDLTKPDHRKALLKWLNQWGCRQSSLDYHARVSESIRHGTKNILEIYLMGIKIFGSLMKLIII